MYLAVAWMAGWSIERDAFGPIDDLLPLNSTIVNSSLTSNMEFPEETDMKTLELNETSLNEVQCVRGKCDYGLHNDMQVILVVVIFSSNHYVCCLDLLLLRSMLATFYEYIY